MKKIFVITIVSLFFVVSAFAEAPTNKAIGYDGDLEGLSLRYMAGSIGVQGILGLNYDAPADSKKDSALDLKIGVNVYKCLWEADKGLVNGFAGIDITMDGSTIKDSDTVTNIGIGIGLEPEIFLLDNLSVSTKLGVRIMINGDQRGGDGKTMKDSGSTQFETYGEGVSIVDGVSFNWYF